MGQFVHLGAGVTAEPSAFININRRHYNVYYKSAFIHAEHHLFTVCSSPNVLQMSTTSSLLLPGRGSDYIISINTQAGILSQPLPSPPLTLCRSCLCSTFGHNFCKAICLMPHYTISLHFYQRKHCPYIRPTLYSFVSDLSTGIHPSAAVLFHLKSCAPCTLAREYVSYCEHVG